MLVLKIFTQPNCPKCPVAKALARQPKVQGSRFKVQEYDTSTVDGLAEAAFYQVMATPSLILVDEKGKVVGEWRGEVPSESTLLSKLKKV